MKALDVYLTRATRALPARERRRVREELRGSILERAAEHQLVGHPPAQALDLALQEFGDPARVARGMQRLYTAPRAAFALMLTLLGSAALMTLPALRAPAPGAIPSLMTPETEAVARCSLSVVAPKGMPWWNVPLNWWSCQTTKIVERSVFRRSDLLSALEQQGVQTQVNGYRIHLLFPGSSQAVEVSLTGQRDKEDLWLSKYDFVSELAEQLDRPVRLSGRTNPTLTVGAVNLQIGTPQAPVEAADLYVKAAYRAVLPELSRALPPGVVLELATAGAVFDSPQAPTVQVRDAEGQVYAMVDNLNCLVQERPLCGQYVLRVRSALGGRLALSSLPLSSGGLRQMPVITQTPEAFAAASWAGHPAVLMWRLGTADLRQLTLEPVELASRD
ncbi:permease prefix domain 1-containing protein [Deinococcus gobiensis]|uniref:Uncharacterized protein n=1 Tax=Deinococcus gobiensis (strain DSM 21396 / JCM 16679 / CGMCC 1.7299 / I-0) TaxID=745776 RepID=H8H2B9_DEIGI|nr:permease prefix domain 1-containing protein [Deinococcus gobiensis]AFD27666.1 hypothetical protein DGo_PB0397 [Deinococcus gobiensis I-0]